jgi:hypothetical protein
MAKRSPLELALRRQLELHGLLDTEELKFRDDRKWRFDFAWPIAKVACEVQGGLFMGGRHARPRGVLNDFEKFSEAAIDGWRLILVTGVEINNGTALDRIKRAVDGTDTASASSGRRRTMARGAADMSWERYLELCMEVRREQAAKRQRAEAEQARRGDGDTPGGDEGRVRRPAPAAEDRDGRVSLFDELLGGRGGHDSGA